MKKNEKIKLGKIKKTDLKYFLKWWRDEELVKLTSGIYIESEAILKRWFVRMLGRKNEHYIIRYGSESIGHISLARKSASAFEIHIIIGEKKYRGRGLGTLAINKALDIGFQKMGYKKACLEVRPENRRAIRAYEKCGFIFCGEKKYKNKFQPLVNKMILKKPV